MTSSKVKTLNGLVPPPCLGQCKLNAVEGSNVVYTDVWTSMGQESQIEERKKAFEAFTVDSSLMDSASSDAVFLHCLPAHRGEEVTGEVIDGPKSRVWNQSENRMHAARGLLAWLLTEGQENE